MARERSIVLRLRAEISDYQAKMGQAARSLSDFEKAQQNLGGAAETTMGRLVQSAKINEREWSTVGGVLTGAATATAGIGLAALNTGVDYNAMRQKATQSLTAVTGSTEMAAAQMRRLDDYGKGSWLMRDTLIRAQTDMTGFGIETNKVIPYMESLADAVAATGGTNQDFEELAQLLGKVKSQGKLTAVELMQFGKRGIDAAQLIGDAMGKTASQIRDDITAGAIDADTALDALAQGMGTKFAGASDLVRETWGGAVDNLKAAFRDLSAAWASTLVDPEGGGILVGVVNNIADAIFALRGHVEGMPDWMKTGTIAIGGLGTAAAGAAGMFMFALPKYVSYREAVTTLANTHPLVGKFDTAIGKAGKAVAIAAVSFAAAGAAGRGLAKLMIDTAAGAEELEAATRNLDFDIPFEHMANGYNDFESALRTLTGDGLFDKMDRGLGFLIDGLTGGNSAATLARESFADMGGVLRDLANDGDFDELARRFGAMAEEAETMGVSSEELLNLMPGLRDELIGIADGAGLATDDSTLLAIAMGELVPAADDASAAALTLDEHLEKLTDTQRAALDAGVELAGTLRGARESFIDWSAAIGDGAFVLSDWLDQIEAQNQALLDWDSNMVAIRDRGAPQALLDQLVDMGAGGAEVVAALADASEEDFQRAANAADIARDGMDGASSAYDGLSNKDPIEIEVEVDGALLKVNTLTGEIELITATLDVDADTDPAADRTGAWLNDVSMTVTDTQIDADTGLAEKSYTAVTGGWAKDVTDTNLDLDADPAIKVFNTKTGEWETTTTDTLLDLDPGAAIRVFDQQTGNWRGTSTSTLLSMDPAKARSVFGIETSKWRNTSTSTGLTLNTDGAKASFWNFRSWLGGQSLSKAISTPIAKGAYSGGTVRGLQSGGRVPGPRAGYDNVMWPLHSGGQVLGQPLEGGEFVVRSSQANRPDYAPILEAMNRGNYQPVSGGGLSRSEMLAFARIVAAETAAATGAAVREGAELGTVSGFSGVSSRQVMLSRGGGF